jgi:hypothetical protein
MFEMWENNVLSLMKDFNGPSQILVYDNAVNMLEVDINIYKNEHWPVNILFYKHIIYHPYAYNSIVTC